MPTTPSPLVLINSTPQINGVNVTQGSTPTVSLASNAGVFAWDFVCVGTDETNDAATVNSSISINHANNTGTFYAGGGGDHSGFGQAFIFRSTVNNGVDINGVVQPNYTTTFGVYVASADGYRVGASNETTEGSAAFGWLTKFNPRLRMPAPGYFIGNWVFPTTNYTVQPTDFFIAPDNTTGPITVTLSGQPGQIIVVADVHNTASTHNITVSASPRDIDLNPTDVISTNFGVAAYIAVAGGGIAWKILFKYP